MLKQRFVTQPLGNIDYLSLFRFAFEESPVQIRHFDAAVAYATRGGVLAIDEACSQVDAKGWRAISKRWLVGIDYCRTEPIAIEMLKALPNSDVRIHDGNEVVKRQLCTPIVPYHPKTFVLRGQRLIGAICGSGNLSKNGLTKGHEVGNVIIVYSASGPEELLAKKICRELAKWFDRGWKDATPAASILRDYRATYESSEQLRSPTPTDDDSSATEVMKVGTSNRRRSLGPKDLRMLRACKRLWIEAGNLHHNRGKDEHGQPKPGNQLMLTPMSRVFFGFPANDVPTDTKIGEVRITYRGRTRADCSLRFSNNSMDVLTLPVPGDGGPSTYDQKDLLFEKNANGGFTLRIGTSKEKQAWIRKSRAVEGYHRMTSGRQWGVF